MMAQPPMSGISGEQNWPGLSGWEAWLTFCLHCHVAMLVVDTGEHNLIIAEFCPFPLKILSRILSKNHPCTHPYIYLLIHPTSIPLDQHYHRIVKATLLDIGWETEYTLKQVTNLAQGSIQKYINRVVRTGPWQSAFLAKENFSNQHETKDKINEIYFCLLIIMYSFTTLTYK